MPQNGGVKPRLIANPPNPYRSTEVEYLEAAPSAKVTYYEDASRTILSRNDSPDLPFTYSVNPYRGCQHACAYCYARPTHEYLGFGAGTDFDTQIAAKLDAPALLREAFDKPSWKGEMVNFSGVTDCYQPLEASLRLTRGCLEVCLEYRNPVAVISKHALIVRDAELLAELAREAGCTVSVSLAWADDEIARAIEPWAAAPSKRFKVIEALATAGVPVGVMCAPVIPGLNDDQLVRVLERAREAGATHAGWVVLRLPGAVAQVFEERLRVAAPLAADKVMHRVRETRGGGDKLYDPRFHARGRGEGGYAKAIAAVFDATVQRLGFAERSRETIASRFQRPQRGQLSLF